jgi:hypothetical protein
MQTKQNNTIIYLPTGPDVNDRWEVVAAALRAAGITDIRSAPMPCQQYAPRQMRSARPVLLCSAEV